MTDFQGIPVTITHQPGDFKLGRGRDGQGWMTRMKASRGVFKGLDGEGRHEVKAWLGPNAESKMAYRIEQAGPDGEHDEEKLVLGWENPVDAVQAIMAHYPKGEHPIRAIHQLPVGGLEDFLAEGEAWAETAHHHHGRPHEHGKVLAFYGGKRLPAEEVDGETLLGEEVAKAHEPMQDGDRWITVHPNGPGTKGQPVLLRPVKGMPGVHRVVGGAGGKLNFLRIHLTKNPEDYKRESVERRNAKRAEEKEALAKMSPEEREQHEAKIAATKEARRKAEADFIRQVLGDDAQEGETPDLFADSPEADPKAKMAYHRERLRQAFAACKEAERQIVLDAEARMESGLAKVGGSATPGMAIDAILTTREDKGPGYDRAITERATANGLTAEKLLAATDAWKEANGLKPKGPGPTEPGAPESEEATKAAIQTHLATKELQQRRAEAMAQAVGEALKDKAKLGDLLRARGELRKAYEEATEARTGRTFLPGFLATQSEPSPEDQERLVGDLTEQILRSHVSTFLDEVEKAHPDSPILAGAWDPKEEEGMAAARGGAAWGALHEAGLAIFGDGLLERDTVEVLGPEGAAQVLALGIRKRFSPADQQEILKALETTHLQEQQADLPAATEEAQRLRAEAQTMKEQMLATPRDFAAAAEMQRIRVEALKQARTTLGAALGRFEARAALIAALQSTPAKALEVPMGRTRPERAFQAAAAMGLMPDDFELTHKAGEAVLTIPSAAQEKLLKPVDHAAVAERELAVSIKRGEHDEEGWRPAGFADRTASRYDNPLMEPKVYQRRVELPEGAMEEHLEPAIARYIGQRWADGHRGTDINADIRGMGLRDMVPEHLHGAIDRIVNKLVPTHELVRDEQGEPIPEMHNGEPVRDTAGKIVYKTRMREPRQIADDIAALGRKHLDAEGMGDTLEGQSLDPDHPDFREALHRALAEDPRLQAAHTPLGELTHLQQKAMRDWFYQEHHSKRGKELAAALEAMGPEPPKFDETTGGMSLFEDLGPVENPAWVEYQQKKAALIEKHSDQPGESPWGKYIEAMGGLKAAQEAIQGEMQSKLAERFHDHFGKLTGKVLQLGTGDIAHYSTHLKATSGAEKAAELEAARKAKQAQMQKQGGGKFKSVRVKEKMEQAEEAGLFGQGGALFGTEDLEGAGEEPEAEPKWEKPETAPGERFRLGGRIEAQIQAAMPYAAQAFQDRGLNPNKIREGMSMSGRYAPQQRGVKAFTALKRMGLFYGAGSGKSSIMLGGASELIHKGTAKKVMMAVPSIVQGQFGSEAAQFLDPKSGIKVHARPGESFEERLAAYRDPEKHAVVITHQALRDDSIKLLAQHQGKTEDEATKWAMEAKPEDLKAGLKAAFQHHGADFDALMVDEGHDALNRKGKADSLLARVIDAHGHNASHYIGATGSPVKNDSSEAFDWLHKIDPVRYPREKQAEFLRRYGQDSPVARRALKAELSRYFFTERVGSGKAAHHRDETIQLDAEQRARVDEIERASGKLRLGDPDSVKWAKMLAPAAFEGKPEAEHQGIADGVKRAIGTFREAAMDRALNIGGAKTTAAVKMVKDRMAEGKPVVIFAHRLDAVEAIHAALEKEGVRVASLTGKDSSKDKFGKIQAYQRGDHDVLVASDAAATGANLQRGKVLIHMDQPMTYKTHEQRTARIDRLGQTEDVEVVNLMADHEWDRKARARVGKKQVLATTYQSNEGYLDDSGLAESLRFLRARKAQAAA